MRRLVIMLIMLVGLALVIQQTGSLAQGQFMANTLLPPVPIPADNPQTDAKIRLGAQLYFDTRLSADSTISCATCHDPRTGWANHGATDTGIYGQVGGRNSGTIINSGYMRYQFWDGRAPTLEAQALGPIHNPIEMGETLDNVVLKLNAIPGYVEQFQEVFGTDVTTDGIAKAIASFERTIVSGPSPFDLHLMGDNSQWTSAADRGMDLFNGKAHCTPCHSGPLFSDQSFHNLGVGQDKEIPDPGRFNETQDPNDMGRFKTPTLRNIALTYPYLHTGSEQTLMDVVNFYDRGGIQNDNLDPLMLPLALTQQEKEDLVAFLESLTGTIPEIPIPEFPEGPGLPADPGGGLR
jgi:cytochrome c peroxidase